MQEIFFADNLLFLEFWVLQQILIKRFINSRAEICFSINQGVWFKFFSGRKGEINSCRVHFAWIARGSVNG